MEQSPDEFRMLRLQCCLLLHPLNPLREEVHDEQEALITEQRIDEECRLLLVTAHDLIDQYGLDGDFFLWRHRHLSVHFYAGTPLIAAVFPRMLHLGRGTEVCSMLGV